MLEAATLCTRRRLGTWTELEETALRARLTADASFATAFANAERAWEALNQHAAAPELMALREEALGRARRAGARGWLPSGAAFRAGRLVAASAAIAVVLGVALPLSPLSTRPKLYQTGPGEQRVMELADHTRIALDSKTRLRVLYSREARLVELIEGQAQFSVAKDASRPFKVRAGKHTVVAVGTAFTVEYVEREFHVALLEGKVAVLSEAAAHPSGEPPHEDVLPAGVEAGQGGARVTRLHDVELTAGEDMRVREDGGAPVIARADLEAATAWRQRRIIFHDEPLVQAVRRLNRYSREQLTIDDVELSSLRINGVFEAGDSRAFTEALTAYLPVTADVTDSGVIYLRTRSQPH
jgi:transmembrane sensor